MPDAAESAGAVAGFIAEPGACAQAMRPVLDLARRAARSSVNALITGESGTGKRSLARWIHAGSARRAGPVIAIGSAALRDALLAGPGSGRARAVFDDAAGGTLVIDELFELSYEAQAALVQLLDEPALQPVGTAGTRVIATTRHTGRSGRLRPDLYYAISVIAIAVPPLRERTEDIPALVTGFLARARGAAAGAAITDEALAWLAAADWPGNVRELETAIERAVALSDGGAIGIAHLAGVAGALAAPATSPDHRRRRSFPR